MNSRQMHSKAQELAASHIPYNLALRLLAREEELEESRREQSAVPPWLSDIASQLCQACGAYDMPDRVMDVLSDLQGGKRPKSVDILPVHPPTPAVVPKGKNRYGLDARYFHQQLGMILRDIDSYTPDGMMRALAKLSLVASPAPEEPK